ncbi:hypothetical protein ABMA28_010882 [Loxostege sticticalis]|uniref:Major facilitator superfamily (MFS) profile domain-containing protein n=1 Tax=Loxostege sticticalis TaxID=481309 RepID=A0ABD0S7L9_LOXSC
MAFGCIGAGIFSDKYGRRFTHLIVSIPFVMGWIVLAFASNVLILLIGRILTGLCTGVFRSLGAVYLGEISSPTNRPLFIFSLSLSGTGGILLGHILGGYLNWRVSCFIICLPIVIGFGLQLFAKESPLWLLYKGRIDQGTEGFKWFRGNDECAQRELAEVLEKQKNRPPNLTFKEGLRAMFSKVFMIPLLTAFLLFLTVQFSGVNTMSFYAQDLLKSTFSGKQDPFTLMLVTDSARVIGVTLLFCFSKFIPRRKSYVIICATLVILLVVLIAYIAVKPSDLDWLAITVMVSYIALGSIMVGLSWTFIGEIFPSQLRGLGSGIGASCSFFLLFLSVNITPGIMTSYGIIATYSMFAILSFFGLLFLYFLLPHTDGKTLQEIENNYDKNKVVV